jgi:hypothetical protein
MTGSIPDVFDLIAAVDVAVIAQMGPEAVPRTEFGGLSSVLGGAVSAFLSTLLVGALLIGLAPEYTRGQMTQVLERPVDSFLYGLAGLLVLFFAIFVFVITVVGILIAIPLAILAYLTWAIGAAIAFLSIGDRLVGHEDGWAKPLLVGAAINGGLTLTGIGGIITFGVGAVGFGTVLRGYFA